MYEMVTENKFGICILGGWKEFKHDHIVSYGKELLDFEAHSINVVAQIE